MIGFARKHNAGIFIPQKGQASAAMRVNDKHIKQLQAILRDEFGLIYTDEQAQEAGLAIMRFIISKHRRNNQSINKENEDVNNDAKAAPGGALPDK